MNKNSGNYKKFADLDKYLTKTIDYLALHWFDKNTGIVACSILDKQNRFISATSTMDEKNNNWIHAEHNAVTKYESIYHTTPTPNAVFIITLSPCVIDMKHRIEGSCSSLIKSLGIKRIHFGHLDLMHIKSIDDYNKMGFDASVTTNTSLALICKKLVSLFAIYDDRINTELHEIKKELGDSFWEQDLTIMSINDYS